MADIVLSVRAYCKMLLHAMKFPHRAVNGIFLADKRPTKEGDVGTISIVDCIPLFHINLALTPMLEAAFMQIDQYCKANGFVIAGYYQANEFFRDSSPNFIAFRIAEKIADYFTDSCLIMVDNQRLSLDCDDIAFHLYQMADGKWKLKDKNSIHMEEGHRILEVASSLLYSRAYQHLVDFDCHLDNIALEWTNPSINKEILQLLM